MYINLRESIKDHPDYQPQQIVLEEVVEPFDESIDVSNEEDFSQRLSEVHEIDIRYFQRINNIEQSDLFTENNWTDFE